MAVLSEGARARIEALAREQGFDLAGLAPVPLDECEDQRFAAWVERGAAGEMQWLQRRDPAGKLVRGDLRRSIPWARSVLVCAVNYNHPAPRSIDPSPAGSGWIARYAWSGQGGAGMAPAAENWDAGSDYHEELLPRLKGVVQRLQQEFGPDCEARPYVDTGPLLERGYAARAGIGWIGRNTCVLNQGQGSWLLLGVVVTSLELGAEMEPAFAADRCGSCTRCIDACPTDALHGSGLAGAPREMDATRCIAYLTIEKKGAIPTELRGGMGRQVFGCDICQDVCPWNRHAPAGGSGMLQPRQQLINPSLAWLGAMDGSEFRRWFRGSPLERTRHRRILRNVAIAMGNSGQDVHKAQLESWLDAEDPVLAESAAWALERLRATGSHTEAATLD